MLGKDNIYIYIYIYRERERERERERDFKVFSINVSSALFWIGV